MSAEIEPTSRFASGATAVRYLSAMALAVGSTLAGSRTKAPFASFNQPVPSGTPFWTTMFFAAAVRNRLVRVSTVTVMSVTSRPNEPALVTTDAAPDELGRAQLYQLWVWPEITTPYSGRS